MKTKSDEENSTKTIYDARIVQTVRNLKKLPSNIIETENESLEKDTPEILLQKPKQFHEKSRIGSFKENIINRVSIEGSNNSTSDSSKNIEKPIKVNKSNKKRFSEPVVGVIRSNSTSIKYKTEFQKKLMSENNINKYKTTCLNLIKEDEDLSKLCEKTNIIKIPNITQINQFTIGNQYDSFLEENFFSDKLFLYKLESLLLVDSSKQNKEKFFKDELKQFFELKSLDIQYDNKINSLNELLSAHFQRMEEFNFSI